MTRESKQIYEFGPYRVNADRRLLLRDGEVVPLTPKCFDILLAFVESSGKVVGKETLLERVWPDSFVEEGNLTYNISMLRKALGERAGEHQYIVTVPGRGYQFVETVRELSPERSDNGVTGLKPADLVVLKTAVRSQHEAILGGPDRERSPESFFRKVTQNKRAGLIVAAMLVIVGAGISLGLYKLISRNQSDSNFLEPFQKMRVTRLTTEGKASVAASSPDGKYLVHAMGARRHQSLWLRHIATGSDKEIIPTDAVDYIALTFSPDGNYIYFVKSESVGSSLYRVPVLGDSIQKLVIDVDSGIAFSFDGRQIAYIRGYPQRDEAQLITANADGTGEQTLVSERMSDGFGPTGRAWGPAWSPDGERIAFALKKDEPDGRWVNVMTVGVKDRTVQQITFQKWVDLGQLAWLSDGSGLIAAAGEEDSNLAQLWHVSYPTGEVRRITNDANDYSGVSLTANSEVLVTVQSEQSSNIWVAPGGDASRAAQITFSNFDGVDGISWAPDGRILYTTRARGSSDIWIMNGDGTAQKQLTVDARDNLRPAVSADGRYVVFASNRTGNRCVWRVDIDGTNPKQLSSGMEARAPQITPDGQWVAYVDVGSGTATLWKVSIEGDNQVQLTDYYSEGPAVSPDGEQIAFAFLDEQTTPKRMRIAIMPFSGGTPTKVLDQPVGRRITWALDGRALMYADTRNGVSNIWGRPMDDSPAKQLTSFTTDLIFAFAWSKDGKQLACARGNRNSDVVMISGIR